MSVGQCEEISEEEIRDRTLTTFLLYEERIMEAKKYTEENGAFFYHFFQPTIVSKGFEGQSEYEKAITKILPIGERCGVNILEKAIPIFGLRYHSIESDGRFTDLSRSLLPEEKGREYFFDWIHVSANANNEIAKSIYKKIKPTIIQ
jgi:hypothetical protein